MSTLDIDAMAAADDRPFRRRAFAGHAFAFVVVNALVVAFWAAAGDDGFWPMWVLAAWGAVLAVDAWRTFRPSDVKALPAAPARPAQASEAIAAS